MKLFAVNPRTLRLLDSHFGGAISNALAEVAHNGCEPVLLGNRIHGSDGRRHWSIIVSGDGADRGFSADQSPIAIAFAAHLIVADFAAEVRADLAATTLSEDLLAGFDDHLKWPHDGPGGVS